MAPCLSMCRWGGEEQQHNSTIGNERNDNDLVRYSAKEGAVCRGGWQSGLQLRRSCEQAKAA